MTLVAVSWLDIGFLLAGTNHPLKTLGVFRIIRLLRVVRVARLLQMCPEIRLLIQGLIGTVFAAFWAMVLLALLAYMGALFCAVLIGSTTKDEELLLLFGSVPRSMLTHFRLSLVEAWPDVAAPMLRDSSLWAWYCAAFIILSNITLLNVVTGIVCEQVLQVAQRAPLLPKEAFEKKMEGYWEKLENLFNAADMDANGRLEEQEHVALLRTSEMRDMLKDMGIGLPLRKEWLLTVLDESHKGRLTCDEWIEGLLRLRGTGRDHLSEALQYDLLTSKRHVGNAVGEFEQRLKERMTKRVDVAGGRLLKKARECQASITKLRRVAFHDASLPLSMPFLSSSWKAKASTAPRRLETSRRLKLKPELPARSEQPSGPRPFLEQPAEQLQVQNEGEKETLREERGVSKEALKAPEPPASPDQQLTGKCQEELQEPMLSLHREHEQRGHSEPRGADVQSNGGAQCKQGEQGEHWPATEAACAELAAQASLLQANVTRILAIVNKAKAMRRDLPMPRPHDETDVDFAHTQVAIQTDAWSSVQSKSTPSPPADVTLDHFFWCLGGAKNSATNDGAHEHTVRRVLL